MQEFNFETLPIYGENGRNEAKIRNAIRNNDVLILTVPTSSGKSTQLGVILLKEGFRTIITVPRIPLAEKLAKTVAAQLKSQVGDVVGYATGDEKVWCENTQILFVTDGCFGLAKSLLETGQFDSLMIDESHLFNHNQWALLVISRKLWQEEQSSHKLLITSATHDPDLFADFLKRYTDARVKTLELEGRRFTVKVREPLFNTEEEEAAALVRQGHNVLLYERGQHYVFEKIKQLKTLLSDVECEILPYFSRLSDEDRELVHKDYDCPLVIVATDAAGAGFNPGARGCSVVDCGMRKSIYLNKEGLPAVTEELVGFKEKMQRLGRASRFQEGDFYISFREINKKKYRLNEPRSYIPQIKRMPIHNLYLRLLSMGISMRNEPSPGRPYEEQIAQAERTLFTLGCIDSSGNMTFLGELAAALPVDAHNAVMIIKAQALYVGDDIMALAAINEEPRFCPHRGPWNSETPMSDCIENLKAYFYIKAHPECIDDFDINRRAFDGVELKIARIRRVIDELVRKGHFTERAQHPMDTPHWEEAIRKAVLYGFHDQLFLLRDEICGKTFQSRLFSAAWGDETTVIGKSSVRLHEFQGKSRPMIVGRLRDGGKHYALKGKNKRLISRLETITVVEREWLFEVAAHLITTAPMKGDFSVNSEGLLCSPVRVKLRGRGIGQMAQPVDNLVQVANWLAEQHQKLKAKDRQIVSLIKANAEARLKAEELNSLCGETAFECPLDWGRFYRERLRKTEPSKWMEACSLKLDSELVSFIEAEFASDRVV